MPQSICTIPMLDSNYVIFGPTVPPRQIMAKFLKKNNSKSEALCTSVLTCYFMVQLIQFFLCQEHLLLPYCCCLIVVALCCLSFFVFQKKILNIFVVFSACCGGLCVPECVCAFMHMCTIALCCCFKLSLAALTSNP